MTMTEAQFPFQAIVVSFPDTSPITTSTSPSSPLGRLADSLPASIRDDVTVLGTSDPYGARCGSGGGTVAALDYADRALADKKSSSDNGEGRGEEEKQEEGSILIVHAGGESSRCPTQMVLGKAWSSLPIVPNAEGSASSPEVSSGGGTTNGAKRAENGIGSPKSVANGTVANGTHANGHAPGKQGEEADDKAQDAQDARDASEMQDAGTAPPVNPTTLLVSELSTLLADLPAGSVVVAASDVLLGLPRGAKIDFSFSADNGQEDCVLGLAVPAPLRTAKNHGVYALEPYSSHIHDTDEVSLNIKPRVVTQFLQKPSPDEMRGTEHCTFGDDLNWDGVKEEREEECAWIDTGVVVFLPAAASKLRNLARDELKCCTWAGLQDMFMDSTDAMNGIGGRGGTTSKAGSSIEEYAKKNVVKVELYSHLMLALSTSPLEPPSNCPIKAERRNSELLEMREAYLTEQASPKVPRSTLESIYDALSGHPLQAVAVPSGRFVHLGTTAELLDFVVGSPAQGKAAGEETAADAQAELDSGSRSLGKKLGLVKQYGSFVTGLDYADVKSSTVLSSCIVCTDNSATANAASQIGSGTAVEHVNLTSPSVKIGNNCLVSGLRGVVTASSDGVVVPDGMCLQMLPMKVDWSKGGSRPGSPTNGNSGAQGTQAGREYVYMYLSVTDPIKERSTLFGIPIDALIERTGLAEEDLWDVAKLGKKEDRTVWHARIHPVVRLDAAAAGMAGAGGAGGGSELPALDLGPLEWVAALLENEADAPLTDSAALESLERWKSLPRLSLSEIRNLSDSESEFAYRHSNHSVSVPSARVNHLYGISRILRGREHVPTDLGYCVYAFAANGARELGRDAREALEWLDDVIVGAVMRADLDVVGRVCMVMSGLFGQLATAAAATADAGRRGGVGDATAGDEWDELWEVEIGNIRSSAQRQPDDDDELGSEGGVLSLQTSLSALASLRDSALFERRHLHQSGWEQVLRRCSANYERVASAMTELCVSSTSSFFSALAGSEDPAQPAPPKAAEAPEHEHDPAPMDTWSVATSPARVDLCGGWSDTPPVSYEFGGAVAGLAVKVDGRRPLSARCRRVPSGGNAEEAAAAAAVVLRTEGRDWRTGDLLSNDEEARLTKVSDLADYRDPTSPCTLLKCSLLTLGLLPVSAVRPDNHDDLRPYVNKFCQSDVDVCLEVVSTSLLPQGSGMGTSSILGGCILAAIGRCVGIDVSGGDDAGVEENGDNCNAKTKDNNKHGIIDAVLRLEQLLTTGGGWQDQIGGLIGGLKVGTSPQSVPLQTLTEHMPLDPAVVSALNARLVLAFTGKPRLAKNILRSVLRRWAGRSPDIVGTVKALVDGAWKAADAAQRGDLDGLGRSIDSYWAYKKEMAGAESGAEPDVVRDVLETLKRKGAIVGGSLCGAGGGGFFVMVASEGYELGDIRRIVDDKVSLVNKDVGQFTWHECTVSEQGLQVEVQHGGDTMFDIAWHD